MKNSILYIVTIVIIILAVLISKIIDFKNANNEIRKFNSKYEETLDKEIYGVDIATLINKAIDDNGKENLAKDDEEYINIDIKITDFVKDKTYNMEIFYNGGIEQFVKFYSNILFKCTEIKYSKSGKVNYMLFEQIEKN